MVAEHESLSKCLHENADGPRLSLSHQTCRYQAFRPSTDKTLDILMRFDGGWHHSCYGVDLDDVGFISTLVKSSTKWTPSWKQERAQQDQ